MNLSSRTKLKWKQSGRLLLALFCVAAALVISILDSAEGPPLPEGDIVEMSEGWLYTDAGGSMRRLRNLHRNVKPAPGQAIHIENTFPETLGDGMFLCFRSSQQSVRVFVDEKEIYEYDETQSRLFSKATPSAWNFVPLPPGAAGKTVALEMSSPYAQNSGQLHPVYLGSYSAVELYIVNMQLPQFIISIAMSLLALTLFLVSFWLMKSKETRHVLHSLALFILLVGIWVFGESKMPYTFSLFNLMESSLVFYAVFLMPMPYLDYMQYRLHPRRKKVLSVLYYAALANVAVCTLLQIFQVADLIELLPAAHVMIILTAIYTIFALVSDGLKSAEQRDWLELAGMIVLCICVAAELGLFYGNNFSITGTIVPLGILVYLMLLSLSTVRNLMRQSAEAARLGRELQESQDRLLVSQIKPHFVYNTLGAIQAYIMKSPNTAYKMVQDFSDYLRANIQSITNDEPIPFATELKHVLAYTDIELIRFRNRIQVVYEIGPADFFILPLTVQPLVENAIKHGLCGKVEGGTVWIRTQEHERDFTVTVEDNGIGFDVSELGKKEGSVGLTNTQNRLKLRMNAETVIFSMPGQGTRVKVILPKEKTAES